MPRNRREGKGCVAALLVVAAIACSTRSAKQPPDGGGAGEGSGATDGGGASGVGGRSGSLGTGGDAAGGGGTNTAGTGGGSGGVASGSGGAGMAGTGAGGAGTAGAGASCSACQGDREWTQGPVAADAPPASAYVTTAKTVTDTVTGLVWQRTDGVVRSSWDDSNSYCQSLMLEGLGGWRLPTLIELESLVDYSRSKPAVEPTAFPATPASDHWTSTLLYLPGEPTYRWTVNFGTGANAWDSPPELHAARCVRCACATPSASSPLAEAPPLGRFIASPATVVDTITGLTWERQNGDLNPLALSWTDANTYCAALVLQGQVGWRLPTVKELESVTDVRSRQADSTLFPGNVNNTWSATGIATDATRAWGVQFGQGQIGPTLVTVQEQVRCVR